MADFPGLLFLLIVMWVIHSTTEWSWEWRKCKHREEGKSLLEFLNPFRSCPFCREESKKGNGKPG